ncbi:hypothetical protein [Budvicia aquatica]|uniref:hypothetical protein n=1 Tax=Budvicia aquatica TaxID=82979 RepID=UPI002082AF4A|nr:hypothetical protein [Budvicia aquatica]GKX52221.1 hypothetical protein SOASR029_25300 [Budvicia aquatica]
MNSKIETELNYRLNLACIKLSDFKRILSYILEDKAFEEPDDWEEFTQTFISLLCALKQDIQNHVNPLSLKENKKWFEVNKIITNTLSTIEPVKRYSSINGTTDTYGELLNQLDKILLN